jgi:hypothetical protein
MLMLSTWGILPVVLKIQMLVLDMEEDKMGRSIWEEV